MTSSHQLKLSGYWAFLVSRISFWQFFRHFPAIYGIFFYRVVVQIPILVRQ
ncbi:MAG: hypothetical protein ACOC2Z_14425 [Coleofasciculus sp.]